MFTSAPMYVIALPGPTSRRRPSGSPFTINEADRPSGSIPTRRRQAESLPRRGLGCEHHEDRPPANEYNAGPLRDSVCAWGPEWTWARLLAGFLARRWTCIL